MMDNFEQLGLLAEISAALLGFIAVFIALSNEDGKFSESDRHFIQALVLCCTFAIVFALVPGALIRLTDTARAWDLTLYAATACAIVVTVLMAWEQARMSLEESRSVHWLWHVPPWTQGAIAFLMLAKSYINRAETASYFVVALTLMIGIALWCFIAIVFRRFF